MDGHQAEVACQSYLLVAKGQSDFHIRETLIFDVIHLEINETFTSKCNRRIETFKGDNIDFDYTHTHTHTHIYIYYIYIYIYYSIYIYIYIYYI